MSIAGVRSSRGDAYQVAVAVDRAVQMIADRSIAWLEIDSTSLAPDGKPIAVDDVVIRYQDGRLVCCQCKKNQTNFEAWTVADLSGELKKAASTLLCDPKAEVRFYSRADFGQLAKLQEYASQTADSAAFAAVLGNNLQPALKALETCWDGSLQSSGHTAHGLLQRISFVLTPSVAELQTSIRDRLQYMVTRVDDAFNALWTELDNLGAHLQGSHTTAGVHRITRAEVEALLQKAGSMIGAPRAQEDIAKAFASMSAIGRSWRRDIGGKQVDRTAVKELVDAVGSKTKAILLTDGPGAGKTCVLLSAVETLEADPLVATLFLQAREFADCKSQAERLARGLAEDIPNLVSGMSEWRHTVVVIDSLDVLSLSRDHEGLGFFLSLIDRLALIPNVSVVAACRSFDLKYDRRLSDRKWDQTITIGLLDWIGVVEPMLREWKVDPTSLDPTTRDLLGNPRNLALFGDVVRRAGSRNVSSAQELTEAYLEIVVRADPALGNDAMAAIEGMAAEMLAARRLELARGRLDLSEETLKRLLSANVLFEGRPGHLSYGHQTLLDALAVRDAQRKNLSLLQFIRSLPPVPFVRPAIRAFFIYLSLGDRKTFRGQVRAVFEADIAFHIKRLIVESLAGVAPEDDDWSLIHHLFSKHETYFRFLYVAASATHWHIYWMKHLVPLVIREKRSSWLATHVRRVSLWANTDPSGIVCFWTQAVAFEWARDENFRLSLGLELAKVPHLEETDPFPLLEALIALPAVRHDFLGEVLQKCVIATGRGDALLWRYIAGDVTGDNLNGFRFDSVLRCGREWFRDGEFLQRRMGESEEFLNLAIADIEKWSITLAERHGKVAAWNDSFVRETSFWKLHSRHQFPHISASTVLLTAVESAVLQHAKADSPWWHANRHRLCFAPCGALRYVAMLALTSYPEENSTEAELLLLDDRTFDATDKHELGALIRSSAYYVSTSTLDNVEGRILALYADRFEAAARPWVLEQRYALLQCIPASLRSIQANQALGDFARTLQPPSGLPSIYSSSGSVSAPFSSDELLALSDIGLLDLLGQSKDLSRDRWNRIALVGGVEQVCSELQTAASRDSRRFLSLLQNHWSAIDNQFRAPMLDGATLHLRYRHGRLQSSTPWEPVEEIAGAQLAALILDELERHPAFWDKTRSGAQALEACAHVADTDDLADRLLFLAASYINASDPTDERLDEDLVQAGMNSSRGEVADSLIILANNRAETGNAFPELLPPLLRQFARDGHPAVRAMVLHRLAFLQYKSALGWELFESAVECDDERIWPSAEQCLYHSYHTAFDRVKPHLDKISGSKVPATRETWGRISALASLSGHVNQADFILRLSRMQDKDAWTGAVTVWAANAHQVEHSEACFAGLAAALDNPAAWPGVLSEVHALFREVAPITPVPASVLRSALDGRLIRDEQHFNHHGIDTWLCALAETQPDLALDAAELFAAAAKAGRVAVYDDAPIARLLTLLFREAEEREESDQGEMLRRVIQVQDAFLAGPLEGLAQWLRDAERPDS
jgi:hypothetical protein